MSKKKRPTTPKSVPAKLAAAPVPGELLADVRTLVEQARDGTARAVNSALVLLYRSIGHRIRRDILQDKRADYGKQILGTLSHELAAQCGRGFTCGNLTRMVGLTEVFPYQEIVGALSRHLGWSHFFARVAKVPDTV